ncbi:hypothetical protein HUN01_16545 [Nostoc edaphicum CCNP1411]|uniref:Uncharacterized protein n=1 Tax=Nostoc edaphicum CCNP1411 TaxID=1472755 RepID=A0A7D7LEU6_9NOSO|nr:hypothetical protein [Nostoc edaphicum]QMS89111.1 hypothetical protein HUN01_16545 [Nostoc edaphicum CCNP1411]
MLRVTAENFRDRAADAITSVKEIYQLNNLPVDDNLVIERLLTDTNIKFGIPREVNRIITGENQLNTQSSDVDETLDALKAEYDVAVEVFNKLETIDYESKRIVAKTAQPARCLTVKMLLLAKRIQERPPRPRDSERVIISSKLKHLGEQYRNLNISSQPEAEEIKRQVVEQIDNWRKVNFYEQQSLNESISKLLVAADTGRKLSELIDDYPNLNFEVIAARVTQIVGVATSFTGNDYSSILTKINTLEKEINEDEVLKEFLKDISLRNRQVQPPISQLCQ